MASCGSQCGGRGRDTPSSVREGSTSLLYCLQQLSVQAELVALGVLHHDRPRPAVGVLTHDLRAKRNQTLRLRRLAILVDVDVQMDAVLARLAFGHPLEEEPGFDAVGSE